VASFFSPGVALPLPLCSDPDIAHHTVSFLFSPKRKTGSGVTAVVSFGPGLPSFLDPLFNVHGCLRSPSQLKSLHVSFCAEDDADVANPTVLI